MRLKKGTIRGAGAILRPEGRGYAPSRRATDFRVTAYLEFPTPTFKWQLPYRCVGIGRNGADFEPSCGDRSRDIVPWTTISERAVGERHIPIESPRKTVVDGLIRRLQAE